MTENDRWFPSRWGADDELGAMNLLTPEVRLAALSLVRRGVSYELGHVLEQGMPVPDFHGSFFANTQYTLENGVEWHRRVLGIMTNGYSAQNLRLSMSDQSGTHIDQLNHVGLQQDDGRFLVYNGIPNADIIDTFGTKRLGVEQMPPLICRGILADVAGSKGIDMLPIGYSINPKEIDEALAWAGVEPKTADAVFVHTGWGKNWRDPQLFLSGEPGLGKACADWAVEHDIVCWGLDNSSVDVFPYETPGEALPVHIEMLVKNGIRLMENVYMDEIVSNRVFEFCLVALPLKIKGATGSPLRPIAMV